MGTAAVLHKSRLISRQIAAEFGAFSIRTFKKKTGTQVCAELSERCRLRRQTHQSHPTSRLIPEPDLAESRTRRGCVQNQTRLSPAPDAAESQLRAAYFYLFCVFLNVCAGWVGDGTLQVPWSPAMTHPRDRRSGRREGVVQHAKDYYCYCGRADNFMEKQRPLPIFMIFPPLSFFIHCGALYSGNCLKLFDLVARRLEQGM